MNKKYWLATFVLLIVFGAIFLYQNYKQSTSVPEAEQPAGSDSIEVSKQETGMANPASVKCEEDGGLLEIEQHPDGGVFNFCVFDTEDDRFDYRCEEWAYFRGECDFDGDTEKIRQALVEKGLGLADMKVVIHKHFGKYISGGVVPTTADVGGGYFYAVKDAGVVRVLADGNGSIMCGSFSDYPDFPNYLVPECIDDTTGTSVAR